MSVRVQVRCAPRCGHVTCKLCGAGHYQVRVNPQTRVCGMCTEIEEWKARNLRATQAPERKPTRIPRIWV